MVQPVLRAGHVVDVLASLSWGTDRSIAQRPVTGIGISHDPQVGEILAVYAKCFKHLKNLC